MRLASPYFISKSLLCKAVRKYTGSLSGRVLDLGCGSRPYKILLTASSAYVGMDSAFSVTPDIVGKAEQAPFKDGSFDSLLCSEVLEHVPEELQAVTEAQRILRAGGYLLITVPQEWPLHYEPYDFWRFTKFGIVYALEKNGFKVASVERIGGIFSLLGQRSIDVFWQLASGCLQKICPRRWAERIASLFCAPWSLVFYVVGILGDRIEKREALGWVVLAQKK